MIDQDKSKRVTIMIHKELEENLDIVTKQTYNKQNEVSMKGSVAYKSKNVNDRTIAKKLGVGEKTVESVRRGSFGEIEHINRQMNRSHIPSTGSVAGDVSLIFNRIDCIEKSIEHIEDYQSRILGQIVTVVRMLEQVLPGIGDERDALEKETRGEDDEEGSRGQDRHQ